jgi:hypothetical protein
MAAIHLGEYRDLVRMCKSCCVCVCVCVCCICAHGHMHKKEVYASGDIRKREGIRVAMKNLSLK